MRHSFKSILFCILLTILSACTGCQNDTNKTGDGTFYLKAIVEDCWGDPLDGVTLCYGDSTYKTDTTGIIIIPKCKVDGDRFAFRLQKEGYIDHIFSQMVQDSVYGEIKMVDKRDANRCHIDLFDSKAGTKVMIGNAWVEIQANGVVYKDNGKDYNGPVKISVVFYNPDDPTFRAIMPGGDLMGITKDGSIAQLLSYGMLDVELRDTKGKPLQLKDGKPATLSFPVPQSKSQFTPDTIPLWWFDEEKGLWKEEGISLHKGKNYVGQVKHFSQWNCDVFIKNADTPVQIKFVDAEGVKIPCQHFKIKFLNNTYKSFYGRFFEDMTDSEGSLHTSLPEGTAFQIALKDTIFEPQIVQKDKKGRFCVLYAIGCACRAIKLIDGNGQAVSHSIFAVRNINCSYYITTNKHGKINIPVFTNKEISITSEDCQLLNPVVTWKDFGNKKSIVRVCNRISKAIEIKFIDEDDDEITDEYFSIHRETNQYTTGTFIPDNYITNDKGEILFKIKRDETAVITSEKLTISNPDLKWKDFLKKDRIIIKCQWKNKWDKKMRTSSTTLRKNEWSGYYNRNGYFTGTTTDKMGVTLKEKNKLDVLKLVTTFPYTGKKEYITTGEVKAGDIFSNDSLVQTILNDIYVLVRNNDYKWSLKYKESYYRIVSNIPFSIKTQYRFKNKDGIVVNSDGLPKGIENERRFVKNFKCNTKKKIKEDYWVLKILDEDKNLIAEDSIYLNPKDTVGYNSFVEVWYYDKDNNLCKKDIAKLRQKDRIDETKPISLHLIDADSKEEYEGRFYWERDYVKQAYGKIETIEDKQYLPQNITVADIDSINVRINAHRFKNNIMYYRGEGKTKNTLAKSVIWEPLHLVRDMKKVNE